MPGGGGMGAVVMGPDAEDEGAGVDAAAGRALAWASLTGAAESDVDAAGRDAAASVVGAYWGRRGVIPPAPRGWPSVIG